MKCHNCGKEIEESGQSCEFCGAAIDQEIKDEIETSLKPDETTVMQDREPKKKKSPIFKIFLALLVLYIIGSTDNSGVQMQGENATITNRGEVEELFTEALDDTDGSLQRFKKVDPAVLNAVLTEKLIEFIPENTSITYSHRHDMQKILRCCEIAENSTLSEEQKKVYLDMNEAVDQALDAFDSLNTIWDQYDGKSNMKSLLGSYDRAEYMEFYIRYAMDNSFGGKLNDLLSRRGDTTYFYANDVEYSLLWGDWWGENEYCVATTGTFPEAGAYNLLAIRDGDITVTNSGGFQREVPLYFIVDEVEMEKFYSDYQKCEEYESFIYETLVTACGNFERTGK